MIADTTRPAPSAEARHALEVASDRFIAAVLAIHASEAVQGLPGRTDEDIFRDVAILKEGDVAHTLLIHAVALNGMDPKAFAVARGGRLIVRSKCDACDDLSTSVVDLDRPNFIDLTRPVHDKERGIVEAALALAQANATCGVDPASNPAP